jgi:primosomal replication protein N
MEIRAVAIGAVTRQLVVLDLGSAAVFAGFLATARNKRGLLFHVTEVARAD